MDEWGWPFYLFAVLFFGAVFGGSALGRQLDDPYFQSTFCTPEPSTAASVEIDLNGFPQACVKSDSEYVRFVNRLHKATITLCLGRHGVCATGHDSPFEGGRLTLAPGESKTVRFPGGLFALIGPFERTFPVTVLPVPSPKFSNSDIIISSYPNIQIP